MTVDFETRVEIAYLLVDRFLGYVEGDLPLFTHDSLKDFVCIDCGFPIGEYERLPPGTKREKLKAVILSCSEPVLKNVVAFTMERGARLWPDDVRRTEARSRLIERFPPGARVAAVAAARPISASEGVLRALEASETLVANHGPDQGLDRLHTALQAYLRQVCADAMIAYESEASINRLCRLVRETHPAFQAQTPLSVDPRFIMERIATLFDVLNAARTNLAHPNPRIPDPEAFLILNAARTVLHYLDARLHA